MRHEFRKALRCLISAALITGSMQAKAEPVSRHMDPISINSQDSYITGQHSRPAGVIDPYSGEALDVNFVGTEFTAPNMSYFREQQESNGQNRVSYEVTKGLSLNFDPKTGKFDSELRLIGTEKNKFRLKLKPKEVKAVYIYKFN